MKRTCAFHPVCSARLSVIVLLSLVSLLTLSLPGKSDILFQNQQTGQLVNWAMNGTTLVNYSYATDPQSTVWKVVGAADFDGDGKSDLLFQNQQTGQLLYWIMNGTTLVRWDFIAASATGMTGWKVVAVADLNGDNNPDILLQNQTTGDIVYWIMNGTTFVRYGFLPNPGSLDWQVVGAGDFNGDGSPDILLQNQTTGDIVYWIMNGITFVRYGFLPNPGSVNWRVAGITDFNGDGKPDILFQNRQTGTLVYWLMNGATFGNDRLRPATRSRSYRLAGCRDLASVDWQRIGHHTIVRGAKR